MKQFECDECGAIYTLDNGDMSGAMACTCRNKNFKLLESSSFLANTS